MAVGPPPSWGIQPSEFWEMGPDEWWWLYDARRVDRQGMTEDDMADLYELIK